MRGRTDYKGYKCFKVYRDGQGNPFVDGCARYVVFCDGQLVGEYTSQTSADTGYLRGDICSDGVRFENYEGIDRRLRE